MSRVGVPDFPRESTSLAEPTVLSGHLDSVVEATGDLVEVERRGRNDDICTLSKQGPYHALEVSVPSEGHGDLHFDYAPQLISAAGQVPHRLHLQLLLRSSPR